MRIFLLFPVLLFCSLQPAMAKVAQNPDLGSQTDTILKFTAKPGFGFNFDYFIYLPKGITKGKHYLMVETNNGGVNDSIAFHERTAKHTASKSGVANYVSKKLQIPLLVPVFPRSETHWEFYTHALDRDTFLAHSDIERLDLQLLAMIADAKKQLTALGYPLEEKFFITGFSASGTFANRFSMLHPEKIKATASGGINAIAILPLEELGGEPLNYPLGIGDLRNITGKKVNLKSFKTLPKMLYMGESDTNDAAAFDDAYSESERNMIYSYMGKDMTQRWLFIQKTYRDSHIEAEFKTYPDIGHGTDRRINDELVAFFRKHMD
jgi:hypothetical protein